MIILATIVASFIVMLFVINHEYNKAANDPTTKIGMWKKYWKENSK